MTAEKMSAGEVMTSPRDCIHKFGIDPYRCGRCKWDFRNGEPPMSPEDAIKAIDWMLDTRTFDSKEAEGIRIAVSAMAEREAALVKEVEALREDAERYQELRSRMIAADFEWGDPATAVLVFRYEFPVSADLDAMIDAARTEPRHG